MTANFVVRICLFVATILIISELNLTVVNSQDFNDNLPPPPEPEIPWDPQNNLPLPPPESGEPDPQSSMPETPDWDNQPPIDWDQPFPTEEPLLYNQSTVELNVSNATTLSPFNRSNLTSMRPLPTRTTRKSDPMYDKSFLKKLDEFEKRVHKYKKVI